LRSTGYPKPEDAESMKYRFTIWDGAVERLQREVLGKSLQHGR